MIDELVDRKKLICNVLQLFSVWTPPNMCHCILCLDVFGVLARRSHISFKLEWFRDMKYLYFAVKCIYRSSIWNIQRDNKYLLTFCFIVGFRFII
jgi:hypothetical protein